MKTMKDKELGIEFTLKQQQNGKVYNKLVIPKDWKVFDIPLFTALWSIKKYRDAIMKANNNELWIFLKNFDYLKDKFVVRFDAGSDGAILSSGGNPRGSSDSLGVIFWRKLK